MTTTRRALERAASGGEDLYEKPSTAEIDEVKAHLRTGNNPPAGYVIDFEKPLDDGGIMKLTDAEAKRRADLNEAALEEADKQEAADVDLLSAIAGAEDVATAPKPRAGEGGRTSTRTTTDPPS